MQATLDLASLRPFTRAITCLSKYGDELIIEARHDFLLLSSVNSSKSAYCSFKYIPDFFSRYSFGTRKEYGPSAISMRAGPSRLPERKLPCCYQLLTKALLSILKQRSVERSIERCEISIVEGPQNDSVDEDTDSLESKLIIRLHCKNGITKTHRLFLNEPASYDQPTLDNSPEESRIVATPQIIKEIIDHFPKGGPKSDPLLIWRFDDYEVIVKSLHGSVGDAKGKAQLTTELNVGADEFETYNVGTSPVTIGFHLREFNASISYADQTTSSTPSIEISFSQPAMPIYGRAESADCEMLFIISTIQVRAEDVPLSQVQAQRRDSQRGAANGIGTNGRKRAREEEGTNPNATGPRGTRQPNGTAASTSMRASAADGVRKRSMKVVQRDPNVGSASGAATRDSQIRSQLANKNRTQHNCEGSMVPASIFIPSTPHQSNGVDKEPLFLPGSQVSTSAPHDLHNDHDADALKEAGLGFENMTQNEIMQMLEGDEEELAMGVGSQMYSRLRDDAAGNVDMDVDHESKGSKGKEKAKLNEDQVMQDNHDDLYVNGDNIDTMDKADPESLELYEEEDAMIQDDEFDESLGLTQPGRLYRATTESQNGEEKEFRPLFDD